MLAVSRTGLCFKDLEGVCLREREGERVSCQRVDEREVPDTLLLGEVSELPVVSPRGALLLSLRGVQFLYVSYYFPKIYHIHIRSFAILFIFNIHIELPGGLIFSLQLPSDEALTKDDWLLLFCKFPLGLAGATSCRNFKEICWVLSCSVPWRKSGKSCTWKVQFSI